jgi:hypothetical protein
MPRLGCYIHCDHRWLPIMKAYEGGSAAYFATPPVNLVHAYHESLSQITKASPSLDERLRLHRETSRRVQDAARELGLSRLPIAPEVAANGMTAVRPYLLHIFFSEPVDKPVYLVHSCGAQMASSPLSFCLLSCKGASLWQVVWEPGRVCISVSPFSTVVFIAPPLLDQYFRIGYVAPSPMR